MRARRLVTSFGPVVLIVGAVLALLHGYAFGGKIANGDLPTFWLPTYCFLGKSVAAGHLPAWNPYTMGGVPFAADPQSGWFYLPVMALFAALPCDIAIRAMVVLQPIAAGLGIYWFLRTEGTGRSAATVGGLVMAVGIAGSQLTNSLPFSGALAWTALSLAACSRFMHARSSTGRIAWGAATALSWGQLAAAHFSVGMLAGTAVLFAYVISKLWDSETVRLLGSRTRVLAHGAVLAVGFIGLNLAYLLPRLAYLPRTSIALGYSRMEELATRLSGSAFPQVVPASSPEWPLKLATTPGIHPGALALAMLFVPLVVRRFRALAVALAVCGGAFFFLTQRSVAGWISTQHLSGRLPDLYLHSPEWWGYALLPIVAILAGLGFEAATSHRWSATTLGAVGLAAVIWGFLPIVWGASAFEMSFTVVGALATSALFLPSVRRRGALSFAPMVLAAELIGSGLTGHRAPPFHAIPTLLGDRSEPTTDARAYLRPGPVPTLLQRRAGEGRYLVQNLGGWERLQADPRSSVLRIEHVQGYNPVQLRRYWMFVRALSRYPLRYNLSLFSDPSPLVLDLLNVRYVVAPTLPVGTPSMRLIDQEGRLLVYEVPGSASRASIVNAWTVARSSDEALQAVTGRPFDPLSEAVVEGRPGVPQGVTIPSGPSGRVVSEVSGPQEVEIRAVVDAPSILLIRTPYDPNWRATVDGRRTEVLPADFLIQAVPLTPGIHTVRLSFDDPWIGRGLLAAAAVFAGLAVVLALAYSKERER